MTICEKCREEIRRGAYEGASLRFRVVSMNYPYFGRGESDLEREVSRLLEEGWRIIGVSGDSYPCVYLVRESP